MLVTDSNCVGKMSNLGTSESHSQDCQGQPLSYQRRMGAEDNAADLQPQ